MSPFDVVTMGRVVRFANAAGAIVVSRLACADAMPTAEEVDALVSRDA